MAGVAVTTDPPWAPKVLYFSFLWNHGYRICCKSDSVARLEAIRQAEWEFVRHTYKNLVLR